MHSTTRARPFPASLIALLIALLPSASPAATAPSALRPSVIVLSLDGVRHDYLDRGELPALERMMRDGARARALVPVFPASTFPNHVSLATGVPVDRHGIVGNRFLDRKRGDFDYDGDARWLESEPIWISAERQGVRAAVYFWVGAEGSWRGRRPSYNIEPFDGGIGERRKVEQILAWLDLPAGRRPQLIMSWWHGADSAGHETGPDSERTRSQLRSQDAELGRLMAALDARDLWKTISLIVVSDHGMTRVDEALDPAGPLARLGLSARVISAGALAHVYLDDASQLEEALAAYAEVEGMVAVAGDALPARLRFRHPTRIGDLVLRTRAPRVLSKKWTTKGAGQRLSHWLGRARGAHGYDPAQNSDMLGIFLALGRGVPAGLKLDSVSALDLAATAAKLLGIDPPPNSEGKPVPGIGSLPTTRADVP